MKYAHFCTSASKKLNILIQTKDQYKTEAELKLTNNNSYHRVAIINS